MFTTDQPLHTDDCKGTEADDECEPLVGSWLQPQGYYVAAARNQLDWVDQAPWCRVQELAWELQTADEAADDDRGGA